MSFPQKFPHPRVIPAQREPNECIVHPDEPGNRDATVTSPFCVSKRGTRPAKRDAGGSYTRTAIPEAHQKPAQTP